MAIYKPGSKVGAGSGVGKSAKSGSTLGSASKKKEPTTSSATAPTKTTLPVKNYMEPTTMVPKPTNSTNWNNTFTDPVDTEPEWLKFAPDRAGYSGGDGSSSDSYYNRYLEEQQRAIDARINSAVEANNAYIPQVNERSDKALQEAYISREQNRVNAPQALSALGYTGGATETGLMGIQTNYENSRNTINTNRQNALNDIYQNELQIRATGDATKAEAAASYYDKLAAAQAQAAAAAQEQENWQAEYDQEERRYADAAAQQAWQNAYDERVLSSKERSAATASSTGTSGKTKNESYADDYAEAASGRVSPAMIEANMRALIAQYGQSAYNNLLKIARMNYQYRTGNPVADFRILAGEQ